MKKILSFKVVLLFIAITPFFSCQKTQKTSTNVPQKTEDDIDKLFKRVKLGDDADSLVQRGVLEYNDASGGKYTMNTHAMFGMNFSETSINILCSYNYTRVRNIAFANIERGQDISRKYLALSKKLIAKYGEPDSNRRTESYDKIARYASQTWHLKNMFIFISSSTRVNINPSSGTVILAFVAPEDEKLFDVFTKTH